MEVELKKGERVDCLERKNYKIIQDKDRFCFGMDAILLSGFAQVKEGEQMLDLGTGTGILPILWRQRQKDGILRDWRFRKKAQRWQEEAFS